MAKNKVGLILNAGLTATRLYRGWLKQMGAADKVSVKLLDYEAIKVALKTMPITGPGPLLAPLVAELKAEGCTHCAVGCFSIQNHLEELCEGAKICHIGALEVLEKLVKDEPEHTVIGILGTTQTLFMRTFGNTSIRRGRTLKGIPLVHPFMASQMHLTDAIFDRLSQAGPEVRDFDLITRCAKTCIAQGATVIVVGCTDIGEACPKAYDGTRFIDLPFLHAKEIARVANE
jgi:aspartate/glutamate racemase